jgi:hypothetical protein
MNRFLLFVSIIFIASCSKDNPSPASPDVYVCGYKSFNGPSKIVGAYWKNNVPYTLEGFADAVDIVVKGTDIHIAGNGTENNQPAAKYWKNGVATSLLGSTNLSYALKIAVSGNDVYVLGGSVVFPPGKTFGYSIPAYWKNGTLIELKDGTQDADGYGISVSGEDVFVVGTKTYDQDPNPHAIMWKNGVPTLLDSSNVSSSANAIALSGSDIYIVGYIGYSAVYWKNGVAFKFDDDAAGSDIKLIDGSIYIGGSKNNGSKAAARYWKDGVGTFLSDGSSVVLGSSISVTGKDVYVAGYLFNGTSKQAKLWKNDAEVVLQDAETPSWASAVFVVNK